MNALCYKIVFSKRLGTLVAVGEHTAGQGKAAGTGVRTVVFPSSSAASADNFVGLLKSVFASVALSFVTVGYATAAGPAVNTLPTGYSVNSGNVAISSTSSATNAAMTIQQTSDKASINWQSFSIGSGAAVNIQQNSANSVLLNRVVGNDPSQIFGKLTANGQVILINPNGVVFGKGGSVTASAFTASTFGMSDADFAAGKHTFSRNGSTAGVTVEQGASINTTAPSGYVALIGASVDNQGVISTQGGAVVLAAGESVALPSALTDNISVPLSGKVRLELLPSTLNAMVANSGTITTEGGQVLMQAAAISDAVASVTHTGSMDTTGEQGGAVTLQADHGIIKATGTIKANSTDTCDKGQSKAGGDIYIGRDKDTNVLAKATDVSGAKLESKGGFVETSGDWLTTYGTRVIAKDWLLDPTDITIVAGSTTNPNWGSIAQSNSTILASDISANLNAGTSVIIQTSNTNTGSQPGNIAVNESINKTGGDDATTLTLKAHNNITVAANKSISSSNGKLNVVFNSDSDGNGDGGILMNNGSSIVSKGGNIRFGGGLTSSATNSAYAQSVNGVGINFSGTTITAGAGTFEAKGKSVSAQGIVFQGANNITAANYNIEGQSNTGEAVRFQNGVTTLTSSTGDSTVTGTSQTNRGVFATSSTLHINAGNVSGTATLSSGKGEMRLGNSGGVAVNTNGKVTLGSHLSNFTAQSVITANSGLLTIKGGTTTTAFGIDLREGGGAATQIFAKNGSSLTIDGVSTSGDAVSLSAGAALTTIQMTGQDSVTSAKGAINIVGVNTSTTGTGRGVSTSRAIITTDGGNVNLTGTSSALNADGLNASGIIDTTQSTVLGAIHGTVKLDGIATGTGTGAGTNASAAITAKSIEVFGTSKGGAGVGSIGTIIARDGGVTVKGESNGGGSASTNINSSITATGAVLIEGLGRAKHGVFLNGNVQSYGGSITVTGDTLGNGTTGYSSVGGSATGLGVGGSGNLTAHNDIIVTAKTDGDIAYKAYGPIKSNNGKVVLVGESNIIGIDLTKSVEAKKTVEITGTSRVGSAGVNINGAPVNSAGVVAESYTVKGFSNTGNGINLNGTNGNAVTFKSTSTTVDSVIEGQTSSATAWGVSVTRSGLTMDATNGKAALRSSAASNSGVTLGDTNAGLTVTTIGDVTLGSKAENAKSNLVIQGATINANGGKLTFLGKSVGDGIAIKDATMNPAKINGNNGAVILMDGESTVAGAGVNMKAGNNISNEITSNMAGGSITIKGTSATGNGVNVDIAKITANAGNAIVITGDASTAGTGAGKGVYMASAVTANAGGNIDITGTSKGTGYAVHLDINGGAGKLTADTGKVTIKGNSATVAGTAEGVYNSGIISGGSVEIEGFSVGAKAGVYSGTGGSLTTGAGTITSTSTTGDTVITGTSIDGNGVGIYAAVSSAGDVKITGTSTGTLSSAGALSLQGSITAANNVTIKGENTNAGNSSAVVYVNKAINATNGKIDVTATTAGGTLNALQLDSGAILTGKTEVNIKTDTLSIATGPTPATTAIVSAGSTGLVTIKTDTAAAKIDIGSGTGTSGVDSGAGTRTLGLSNAELNRITAVKTVIGDSANTGGITVSAATTTNASTGHITLQTGGDIGVNAALTVGDASATKNLTLNGFGLTSKIDQNSAGVIKAAGLELLGTNATHTLTNVNNEVGTIAANTNKIDFTNKTALKVETVNSTTGITAKTGVSVTTQTGDLDLKETIKNTSSGNVVVGAGVAGSAGELSSASSGDVQTVSGKSITTQAGGKLIVYSGSAAKTGALSYLDSTNFATLKVDGTANQNADTNVAYNAGAGIAGSTAPAQVLFREKVSTGDVGLSGTTVNKTYGDATTANGSDAALFAETKASLKAANTGSYTIGTGPNSIVIDKAVVIDSMTGNLSGPTYNNTNTYLKAATHDYGVLSSSKYTTQNIAANAVQVTVAKRALTGSIAQGNTTYGDALVAGAVTFTNKVGSDVVSATDVTFTTTDKISTSGNLKAGTHADVQSVTNLRGTDKENYTFANVKGSYQVEQKSLTALYAANNKVFDGNTSALVTASLQDAIKGDVVSATHTGANFDSPDVGTGKSVTVSGIGLTGADSANYKVSAVKNPGNTAKTTANITPVPPTPPTPVVPSNATARVKIPVGSSNPFSLASAEDLADDTCTANSIENCYCEESATSQGVDICYEPKAVAKRTVR